jgi:hypothetical protein
MLAFIGTATETEVDVVTGGPAPSLEIADIIVEGDKLRTGQSNTLVVRIANHGPGTAYRVAATTRSCIEAMHGLHLSFGSIKPGSEKQRRVLFTIPTSETTNDAMMVVSPTAANGASARAVNRRIPITISVPAPALAIECTVGGRPVTRLDVDAGQVLALVCVVANTGNAGAQVEIETSVGTTAPSTPGSGRAATQTLPASRRISVQVPITMPRALPIDSVVEIAVTARDRSSAHSARLTFSAVIRKPKLCTPGQLTHPQYRAKVNEFRKAVAAGDITQAEFDRYDAALVSCLK